MIRVVPFFEPFFSLRPISSLPGQSPLLLSLSLSLSFLSPTPIPPSWVSLRVASPLSPPFLFLCFFLLSSPIHRRKFCLEPCVVRFLSRLPPYLPPPPPPLCLSTSPLLLSSFPSSLAPPLSSSCRWAVFTPPSLSWFPPACRTPQGVKKAALREKGGKGGANGRHLPFDLVAPPSLPSLFCLFLRTPGVWWLLCDGERFFPFHFESYPPGPSFPLSLLSSPSPHGIIAMLPSLGDLVAGLTGVKECPPGFCLCGWGRKDSGCAHLFPPSLRRARGERGALPM